MHDGAPLHPRVAALFSRSIVPRTDGKYDIVLPNDRETIEVEDTAFFVTGMDMLEEPDGCLSVVKIHISDGQWEALDAGSLMISDENVLYARITRHGLSVPCRFPPSLYHRLALCIVETGPGEFALPLSGTSYPIGVYSGDARLPKKIGGGAGANAPC